MNKLSSSFVLTIFLVRTQGDLSAKQQICMYKFVRKHVLRKKFDVKHVYVHFVTYVVVRKSY